MATNPHVRSLIRLGLAFASVACLFSSVSFAMFFDLPASIIPGHMLIVLGMLVGSMLSAAVLRTVWRTGKWVTLLPLWAFVIGLGGVYLLNAVGWALWLDTVSFRLVKSYLARSSMEGHDYSLFLLALFASLILPLLPIAYRVMPALFRSVCYLVAPDGLAMFGRTRTAFKGIASLAVYSSLFTFLFWIAMDNSYLSGEFILRFVSPVRATVTELPRTFYDVGKRPSGEDAPYAVSRDPQRKSVVVIVVDDLRADHLPAYGYGRDTSPLLSRRLTRNPVLTAKWATSACSISECGILAINTSRPFQVLNAGLFSLPEALHTAGYETNFITSGDFTEAFRGLYTLAGKHAHVFADGLAQHARGAYDDRVVLESIEKIPDHSGVPAFFYFHLHSVHQAGLRFQPPTYTPTIKSDPYTFLWGRLVWGFAKIAGIQVGPAVSADMVTNNYDNGIRQADSMVDQILSALRRKGYLDRSVVVVTADHGEDLGEHGVAHGGAGHGLHLYADNINIPLFVFDSQFQSSRTVSYATHLDIAPTIADLVGIPIPPQWEGMSLLRTVPEISTAQTTSHKPIESVIWRRDGGTAYKYLYNTLDDTEQLFELGSDPAEQNNLITAAAEPAVLSFLREERIRRFNVKTVPPALLAGAAAGDHRVLGAGYGEMSLHLQLWLTRTVTPLFATR